jgi:hypothetical protein
MLMPQLLFQKQLEILKFKLITGILSEYYQDNIFNSFFYCFMDISKLSIYLVISK